MEYYAKTWNDLISLVKEIRGSVKNPDQLWFRGQSNANFVLLPGLLRYSNGFNKEQFLFQKFRQLSHKVFPRRTNDWETLFDMQHYGVPYKTS